MNYIYTFLSLLILSGQIHTGEIVKIDLPIPKQEIYYPIYVSDIMILNQADDRDLECATLAIYHEGRGESMQGKRMIYDAIINRVKDIRWPNDVCGVVFQKYQF